MAFSDKKYKRLGDVLKVYTIHYEITEGIKNKISFTPSVYLTDTIQFALNHLAYKISEEAICELLLTPILLEVWKPYLSYFSFWSHTALTYDDELKGIPDFLFTRLSPLGHIILEQPYIAVVEAKLDDFVGGWAQCALEMIAMQKINKTTEFPIYGIVTNGDTWEFAKLENNLFTQFKEKGKIEDLPQLMGILTYILEECKRIYIDGES